MMNNKKMLLDRIITIKSIICYLESRSMTYEHNISVLKDYKQSISDEITRITSIAYEEMGVVDLRNEEIKKKKVGYGELCKELEKKERFLRGKKTLANELEGSFSDETQKNIDKILEKCNSYINSSDEYIKRNEDYKKRVEEMKNEALNSLMSLKIKVDTIIECQTEIQNNERKKTKLIYDKLCEDNLDFIHYKDFDKLDYIYYYIETNRTDNIRDALNLVDNQIRHEELVGVLNEAILTICNTISREAERISASIDVLCDRMCEEINKGVEALREDNQHIIERLESIDVNVSSISSSVDKIVDNQVLTNSLLENQNKSCADMLKHYRYVNGMSGEI